MLINCAGVCYPHPEYFAAMSDDRGRSVGDVEPATFTSTFCGSADETIKCNVSAAVHACRLVLPTMMARGRGLIVNVGSASASVRPAMPLMALYVATKVRMRRVTVPCVILRTTETNVYSVFAYLIARALLRISPLPRLYSLDQTFRIQGANSRGDIFIQSPKIPFLSDVHFTRDDLLIIMLITIQI